MPATRPTRASTSQRVLAPRPTRNSHQSPVEEPPRPVPKFFLWFYIDPARLPPSVTTRDPERAVKYFLLLEMFPSLTSLLRCPETSREHPVAVSQAGTMTFRCTKCDVMQVNTRLPPKHRELLQKNYEDYIRERDLEIRRKSLAKDMDEWLKELLDSPDENVETESTNQFRGNNNSSTRRFLSTNVADVPNYFNIR
ncbi:hypothetical protein K435DRAFT_858405 [Dendrothele bispora CBS 962.96]|uniref:Uncharacterized protein n=1 Tax=Dendrothele bispora (strain CBS 962.96) TaxID=1314807 RepID=A0A4S8M335_DENBC|nr:hypothetical protein K435DRAFT_858405 [Dendrothele bispora CBS 962.96]